MGTPAAILNVCSDVPLSAHYDHTIMFGNKEEQLAYFQGKVVKSFTNYTYLRKKWSIKVQASLAEADKWNYLYFRNVDEHTVGKLYFYFIKDVQYINDNTVELFLEMDVLQTYQFEMHFQTCFVERMHSASDDPGDNLVDEGLELGKLVVNEYTKFENLDELCILVLASINPNYTDTTNPVKALGYRYNGVFSGLKVFAVYGSQWPDLSSKLEDLAEAGFLDGIVSMWMYPRNLVNLGGENTWTDDEVFKVVDGAPAYDMTVHTTKKFTTVDGYTPANKKLLTYPFNFLYCSNNMGGSAVYHYERFSSSTTDFKISGSTAPDAGVMLYPANYNGVTNNYDEGLALGGFPSCAWNADIYKMWLAQNQNAHGFTESQAQLKVAAGAVTGVAGAIGSLFTGNIGGAASSIGAGAAMMYSGAAQMGELLAQKRDMEIQPPQARGHFSASVNCTMGTLNYSFYRKSVSREYAKIIDDYFTMYGYKQNRIMYPVQKTRQNYTYVKTVNCVCYGSLPQADADMIASVFDKGITLWWNPDVFGQYSAGNPLL